MRITGLFELAQASNLVGSKGRFLFEIADNRKRNGKVVRAQFHAAIAMHLIDVAVENHHFTIQMFKGSEAEVAMGQQNPRGYRALVNTFNKRGRSRDLIEPMASCLKVLTERCIYDALD